jgi:hypothetical protein
MKIRCSDKNHHTYKHYGAKGISVCNEWLYFPAFHAWAMATGYSSELTIERKDNNQGYSAENCVWILRSRQPRNTSRVKLSEAKARRIREYAWAGIAIKDLARVFNVHTTHIGRVVRAQAWA